MEFYFQLFWSPAVVSAGLLALLWVNDCLPRHAPTFVGWFLLAVALQFFAPAPIVWVLGLLLQTSLAILLFVKFQFFQI